MSEWTRTAKREESLMANAPDATPEDESAEHIDEKASSSEDEAPSVGSVDADEIRQRIDREYALVPSSGQGRRWYDRPMRVVMWLQKQAHARTWPISITERLSRAWMFLNAFNEVERHRLRDRGRMHDAVRLPPNERVQQGGFWLVELYPPSYVDALERAIRKNGWADLPGNPYDGTLADVVVNARRRSGYRWSRLVDVSTRGGRYRSPSGVTQQLPREIDGIELITVQVGRSLTAVIAFFRFSEVGEDALHNALCADHEPILRFRRKLRPSIEDRHFSSILNTQAERQRLHDLGRQWLAKTCPGFFAASRDGAPAVDLTLFDKFDPLGDEPEAMRDPLRALGMDDMGSFILTSPQLPAATLIRARALERFEPGLRNAWGVIARRRDFEEANQQAGYGPQPYDASTLAHIVEDPIQSIALYLAVNRYSEQQTALFSEARDRARSRYRRFSPRKFERLGHQLLSLSLDVTVTARDAKLLWTDAWRPFGPVEVKATPPQHWPDPPVGFDLLERLGEATASAFDEILEEDRTYRDVLGTAASFNATAADARLGRAAIFTAVASLAVAVVTLVATTDVVTWIRGLLTGG